MGDNSTQDAVDAHSIFKGACDEFRAALHEDDRGLFIGFRTCDDMIQSIKDRCANSSITKGRLLQCCKYIQRASNNVQPYFDIINVFCQANPEYTSLAWGAIRVVFLLGSSYATFFERLTQLLSNLLAALERETEYIEKLTRLAEVVSPKSRSRVLYHLSLLYKDIVQFCFEACKLFRTDTRRLSQVRLMARLCWKPFDTRFSEILGELRTHETDLMKQLESSHRLLQIQHIENQLQRGGSDEADRRHENETRQRLHADTLKLTLRKEVQAWIASPDWARRFEESVNRREPGTNEWIFSDATFQAWEEGKSHAIIHLQGKPGFGKTLLCSTLVQHLRYHGGSGGSSKSPPVVFYFFDRRRELATSCTSALRAIVSQLLHASWDNEQVVDIASVAYYQQNIGQLNASQDELISMLALLLRLLPDAILLIDGIDECTDTAEFFRVLQAAVMPHPEDTRQEGPCCRVALFSRPSIRAPVPLERISAKIHLGSQHNHNDIEGYLRPRIQEMFDMGLIAENQDVDQIVEKVTDRANGMFLWVRLFLDYLGSEGLTISDRTNAVDDMLHLQELEDLYAMILRGLARRLPKKARDRLSLLFMWMVYSRGRQTVTELEESLSTRTARGERDRVPNFADTLGSWTGALVEVTHDSTVRFIHLSVDDFFRNLSKEPDSDNTSLKDIAQHFPMKGALAHLRLGIFCLDYLNHTIPPGPLSGSPQVVPNLDLQKRRYPMIAYSALEWAWHASQALSLGYLDPLTPHRKDMDIALNDFLLQLNLFITSKERITTWIEASWLCAYSGPNLYELPGRARKVVAMASVQRDIPEIQLVSLVSKLETLQEDLSGLCTSWCNVLRETPNEIWEPSVPAFTKSTLWVSSTDAKVSRALDDVKHRGSILIMSQASHDGTEMGQIRLFPPTETVIARPRARQASFELALTHGVGWRACYELWNINTCKMVASYSWEIPVLDMAAILYDGMDSTSWDYGENAGPQFEFPVAISRCLRRYVALGNSFDIVPAEDQTDSKTYVTIQRQLGKTIGSRIFGVESLAEDARVFSYQAWFSPDGQYLLVVRPKSANLGKNPDTTVCPKHWILSMIALGDIGSRETLKASNHLHIEHFSVGDERLDYRTCHGFARVFCFHPASPILAVSSKDATFLWNMADPTKKTVAPRHSALVDLRFSACGNHLYGQLPKRMVVMDVTEHVASITRYKRDQGIGTLVGPSESVALTGANLGSVIGKLGSGSRPATQTSGQIIFSSNSNRDGSNTPSMSVLRHEAEQGAIILFSLRSDKTMTMETLSRIPKGIVDAETTITPCGDGSTRLVINRRRRQFYHFNMLDDTELPAIVERVNNSIPVVSKQLSSDRHIQRLMGSAAGNDHNSKQKLVLAVQEHEGDNPNTDTFFLDGVGKKAKARFSPGQDGGTWEQQREGMFVGATVRKMPLKIPGQRNSWNAIETAGRMEEDIKGNDGAEERKDVLDEQEIHEPTAGERGPPSGETQGAKEKKSSTIIDRFKSFLKKKVPKAD
ncbi:hypothetical protein QBC44DRAFT_57923 [Cladorrhinum sp. PSN332]|nr:hypothetical protein QBC44DRAFT_57923 [Cladorrhinum sp. PSN332]